MERINADGFSGDSGCLCIAKALYAQIASFQTVSDKIIDGIDF